MAALLTASMLRPVARPTLASKASVQPFAPLRLSTARTSQVARSAQEQPKGSEDVKQTDSRDSYQVGLVHNTTQCCLAEIH